MLKRLALGMARVFFKVASRQGPVMAAHIQRVLVIKLCCIGDILFSTPLLRALQTNFPRARITYMLNAWCRDLARQNPRVAEVIEYDSWPEGGWMKRMQRALDVIRKIRRARFDVAIILHRTPLAGVLAALGGVPIRIGFDWEGQGVALTHPVPFRADAHEVDRVLDCLKPLDAMPDGRNLEWVVPKEAQAWADRYLASVAEPLVAVFPAGGVNPGTTMLTKRWPVEGFREVCVRLSQDYGARMVLVGSPEDRAVGDAVLAGVDLNPAALRAEGETSLAQLAALVQRCRLFIGGDSGPLYLAAAVGTPTVSLFGPSDPRLVAPRGEDHRTVYTAESCSPCYNPVSVVKHKDQATACQDGEVRCMRSITADAVLAAAAELLRRKGTEPRS